MNEIATQSTMPWKVKVTIAILSPLAVVGVVVGMIIGGVKFGMAQWDRYIHWTFK